MQQGTEIKQRSDLRANTISRTMAATSDCIIFLFLGMVVVTETHML